MKMRNYPSFGNGISVDLLNRLDSYALVAMEEPWEILKSKVDKRPTVMTFNKEMNIEHLNNLAKTFNTNFDVFNINSVIGLGGGTACDTAKFLTWKFNENREEKVNLYLIPSIISVDAFLCSSIAIREDNKVKYVGASEPKEIIIDYDLIKQAPPYLNRAGVSDTISITSALGDWKIAHEKVNENLDKKIFTRAKKIALDLMKQREEIRDVTNKGIKALVDGLYKEVSLCEEWGNARPEEGSEHFFAYCIESITRKHYIHGNLIGMAVLISLYIQGDYAEFEIEELEQFFKDILINISPRSQKITEEAIVSTLKSIKNYVVQEDLFYSVFNMEEIILDDKKIDDILEILHKL